MAIDGADRPVSGAGSQLGWLLWAGALDEHGTRRAVQRLTRADILTTHGVRTLADTHPAFLADGYHRGAVWPFDSWIAWGGLLRAGACAGAEQVRAGVRDALARLGRYPELYEVSGDTPVLVPFANRVQAWTLGAAVAFDAGWTGHPGTDPPL
jgi:glycogen debranching enzyme